MNTQNTEAPQIPNPPGGGSWSWDEAARKWVSLDPQPDGGEEGPAAPATPIPHDDNLPEN